MVSYFQLIVSAGVLLAALSILKRKARSKPLPPGPSPWPVIGNVLDMPKDNPWETFTEWRKTHGDIVSLSIFGRTIIILNSAKVAVELLGKRSSHYSDRPQLTMCGELMGWDGTLFMSPSGERYRQMRRSLHQVLGPRPSQAFWHIEEYETARLLGNLLKTPNDYADHIRRTTGSIILKISHGYTVSDGQDELIDLTERVVDEFSQATVAGAFLVDFVPWLKYVPSWFPGAGFKRTAEEWRKDLFDVIDATHEFTKSEMKRGKAPPSFTSEHMANSHTPESELLIKWTAFSMMGGGADTTVAALKTFFLAMCTHPGVQTAAQSELDALLGSERMPKMTDLPSLPYIHAIVKEVLRWGPVAPMVPYELGQDDEYEGYRLPNGSIVLANIWSMLHDPEIYAEPAKFRPERFIGKDKVDGPFGDPFQLAFGNSRRVCPGRNLAEASMFLTIAMTLATFTISKACDNSGAIIEPEIAWTSGTISHPKPFRCQIKPRSARAVELIKQTIEAGK